MKSTMHRGGRLPDGRETLSDAIYVKEWRELGEAIGDLLDMQLYAFDPDIALRNKPGAPYGTMNIPARHALRIKKLMETAGWVEKYPGWKKGVAK
jgi:hypothetical protein